jgi:hypothetical protein
VVLGASVEFGEGVVVLRRGGRRAQAGVATVVERGLVAGFQAVLRGIDDAGEALPPQACRRIGTEVLEIKRISGVLPFLARSLR